MFRLHRLVTVLVQKDDRQVRFGRSIEFINGVLLKNNVPAPEMLAIVVSFGKLTERRSGI